jgi:hypothetical protein
MLQVELKFFWLLTELNWLLQLLRGLRLLRLALVQSHFRVTVLKFGHEGRRQGWLALVAANGNRAVV